MKYKIFFFIVIAFEVSQTVLGSTLRDSFDKATGPFRLAYHLYQRQFPGKGIAFTQEKLASRKIMNSIILSQLQQNPKEIHRQASLALEKVIRPMFNNLQNVSLFDIEKATNSLSDIFNSLGFPDDVKMLEKDKQKGKELARRYGIDTQQIDDIYTDLITKIKEFALYDDLLDRHRRRVPFDSNVSSADHSEKTLLEVAKVRLMDIVGIFQIVLEVSNPENYDENMITKISTNDSQAKSSEGLSSDDDHSSDMKNPLALEDEMVNEKTKKDRDMNLADLMTRDQQYEQEAVKVEALRKELEVHDKHLTSKPNEEIGIKW
ncbi:hypothetical protein HYV11_03505 [Candidatus Dependentiae bacterium]|nr:hypothetical protein [Candidatus Dependentiae bacterium]